METDIFDKLKQGIPVDMRDAEYAPAIRHIEETTKQCFRINHAEPDLTAIRPLFAEMLGKPLADNTCIFPPVQVDFGRQMEIGTGVIINHDLTCMSAGGITIGDGVQIGPNVTIVTTNHDFGDHYILRCKGVHIGRNVWIGACAAIMPGVTIGENAVVAGGAVVTKDVEPNTVVGGNPARVIKRLETTSNNYKE